MNSSNNLYKSIDKRVTLLEQFMQIQEFAFQSGQEASKVASYLVPRLSLQNSPSYIPQLDHEFQKSLMQQVLLESQNKSLGHEELMQKLFEIKKSTSYIAWLEGLQGDYKCQNASIITIMIACSYEDDSNLYRKLDDSGALISKADDSFLHYRNEFAMTETAKKMNPNFLGVKAVTMANRRMVTSEQTRLVFTEANHPMADRITVFFNSTEEKEAVIHCSGSSDAHTFVSGTTLELPLFCSITSNWWNVTGIVINSDEEKELGVEEFALKWTPIQVSYNASGELENMESAVKRFIKARNEAIEKGQSLSTEGLFITMNNLAKGVEKAVGFGAQFMEHISNNKLATGAAGLSTLTAIVFLCKRFYKCSSSGNKQKNDAVKDEGSIFNVAYILRHKIQLYFRRVHIWCCSSI